MYVELPPQRQEISLQETHQLLASKDKNGLILGLQPLVTKIALATASGRSANMPDVVGEATLKLVEIVNKALIGAITTENLNGYIAKSISGTVQDFVSEDNVFGPSRKCAAGIIEAGGSIPTVGEILVDPPVTQEQELEVKEIIELMHLDARHQMILDMRLASHTDREIGEKLGLTEMRACQLRKEIQTAYLSIVGE